MSIQLAKEVFAKFRQMPNEVVVVIDNRFNEFESKIERPTTDLLYKKIEDKKYTMDEFLTLVMEVVNESGEEREPVKGYEGKRLIVLNTLTDVFTIDREWSFSNQLEVTKG